MNLKDIVKTRNIIKINPDETLASALAQLSSSHDAAFVFNESGSYMGVINPYYCLIKNSYPGNAKVEHCIFHAPRIKSNFPISKVVQLLIESKVHYLPILNDDNTFIGITSARHLLSQYRDSDSFHQKIGDYLKLKGSKPLITIIDTDVISNAIHIFKTQKISKLVVISSSMKLRGILTYYDLISFLIAPKRKGRSGDREGNKPSFQKQHVKNFVKSYVLTLTPSNTLKEAVELILNKQIGSVLIVNQEKMPTSIITTRDLLTVLMKQKAPGKVEIVGDNLSKNSRQILGGFFDKLTHMSAHIKNVQKVRLFVREEKKGGVFEAMISLIPQKGPVHVIRKQGKNLKKLLAKLRIKKD